MGVLVAVGSAPFEADLLTALDAPGLHVVRRCVDVADLLATATARQAEVALVSAQLRGLDATVVARLRHEAVSVLGVTVEAASADEARLRELGIVDVVPADRLDELESTVAGVTSDVATHRLAEEPDGHVRVPRAATTVAVWGPTGAPGRSTLAVGMAAAAADLGRRTLLVDADVYGGAVAPMLGLLDEASGLLAAARAANHGELGPDILDRTARTVNPTLRVLTGLPRADRWVEVGSTLIRRVIDTAADVSDLVVVDCGFSLEADEDLSYDTAAPRRNGATLEVLSGADVVIALGGADPVGLSRLIRAVHDLRTTFPGVQPRIVVNRVRPSLGWSDEEVSAMIMRATGLTVTATLPDDPASCDRALVQGKTLTECASDGRLTRRIHAVTADLLGLRQPVTRRRAGTVR
ncbi:MAG TPA: hypothetical protein VH419_17510 [Nocardioidaceae bacterium]